MGIKLTTLEFIKRSNIIHNDRYDYSLSNYINYDTPLTIICSNHGEFKQTPRIHIGAGSNCPLCSVIKTTTNKILNQCEFESRARLRHKLRYSYNLDRYINHQTKIKILCNDCNTAFLMRPSSHISGQGCPNCANLRRTGRLMSQDIFIDKLKTIYGDSLSYSKVKYKNSVSEVTVTCKAHGDFKLKAAYLLSNKISCSMCVISSKQNKTTRPGCYSVSNTRNVTTPCILYIVQVTNESENFYKIGITTQTIERRFPRMSINCYNIEVISITHSILCDAFNTEQKLLTKFKRFKYTPLHKFKGHQECISINPLI